MSEEQWRDIAGYEGKYLVSSEGRIKSVDRVTRYSDGRTALIPGKALKPFHNHGYLRVNLSRENKRKNMLVHRIVAEAFVPNPNGKPEVNHINGDKTDNKAANLEWVTGSENMKHAYKNGLLKLERAWRARCA